MTLDDLKDLFDGQIVMMVDGVDSASRSYTSFDGSLVDYVSHEPRIAVVIGLKDSKKFKEEVLTKLDSSDNHKIEDMYYHVKNDKLNFS